MNRGHFFLAIALLLALAGCARPVPAGKFHYVGEWKAPGMYLLITQDGCVQYERIKGGAKTAVTGPIQKYEGDDFSVGIGFLSTNFVVSRPPYQVSGVWKMVVDGVELTKVGGPGGSTQWNA